jgi:PIN domain nuclease of toxin-antitoxin system
LLEDSENDVIFSVISLWEIGVKRALKRSDFEVDPYVLRSRALAYGYQELLLSGEHVLAIHGLPSIHRDPYDRLLACQALTEDMTLLTKDSRLLEYPVTTLRA